MDPTGNELSRTRNDIGHSQRVASGDVPFFFEAITKGIPNGPNKAPIRPQNTGLEPRRFAITWQVTIDAKNMSMIIIVGTIPCPYSFLFNDQAH